MTGICNHCGIVVNGMPSRFKRVQRVFCTPKCKQYGSRKPRDVKAGYIQEAGGQWFRVDPQDEDLSSRSWNCDRHGYPYADLDGKRMAMHRVILARKLGRPLQAHELVDHANRDPLDNRRRNLRLASKASNGWNRPKDRDNRSGFKGVSMHQQVKRAAWTAEIKANGKRVYIGIFPTAFEAAWMYDQWALELHGQFACTNFDYAEVA